MREIIITVVELRNDRGINAFRAAAPGVVHPPARLPAQIFCFVNHWPPREQVQM
jgi:hypothetical protein